MAVLKSGHLGVNMGNMGGYNSYSIQDNGTITVKFDTESTYTPNWMNASTADDGILAVYNGKEYKIPYTSLSSGRTVAFDYQKDITRMEFWGMFGGRKAGEIDIDRTPGTTNLVDDPIGIAVAWEMQNTAPTATISATAPTAGGQVTVSWKFSDADGDYVDLVRLVRYYKAANKTSYSGTTILSGSVSSDSYKDTIPASYAGGSVYYEILFEDNYNGSGSAQTAKVTVKANTAPTVPGVPNLPDVINAGEIITVAWSASSDTDGNLEGYKLERSVNNGGTWEQVYQGSSRSASTKVPEGISIIMYRVKAYDSHGAESGYAVTPVYTVITNTAPTAPTAVTIPAEIIRGNKVVVSWNDASDAEGDDITYELQRSVNGGEYVTVQTTAEKTYTDTVGSAWETVRYRVCAVDSYGAKSEYRESIESKAVSAIRPMIEMTSPANGANLGTVSEAFAMKFTVTNGEPGSDAAIRYYLDGAAIAEDAQKVPAEGTAEYNNAFTGTGGSFWYRIPNGAHTMVIRAAVTKNGEEVYTEAAFTFTKLAKDAVIKLEEAMTASERISVCVVSVIGNIPEDAQMTVEVTNNGNDSNPVWEDATEQVRNGMNHAFSNSTQTNGWAFNFRVTVHGGDTRGYITSIQGGFQ